METPQVLRLSILLCLLGFCAIFWAQFHYFDLTLVQHVGNDAKGFKISHHTEFTITPTAVQMGADNRRYEGRLPPPTTF